jgi:hypothetical protein
MKRILVIPVLALGLVLSLGVIAFADTIRLKDGTVIRGQVVSFKDRQFTVLIGSGTQGRHSRMTVEIEDVESIEFDSPGGMAASQTTDDRSGSGGMIQPVSQPSRPVTQPEASSQPPSSNTDDRGAAASHTTAPAPTSGSGVVRFNVRVRGDNANNGWTNSGFVVRKGQTLRITASGRVDLGKGRVSTPGGIPTIVDDQKLMRTEPTGALIAVIGDDNDDFIFIGRTREFVAQRDGVLFLGVNEGNLSDNTGNYDAIIEADAR